MLTEDAINDLIADSEFAPQGAGLWRFEYDTPGDGRLMIRLIHNMSRDSRTYDWDAEYDDDWNQMKDGRDQAFQLTVDWPADDQALADKIVELAAYTSAHEALEWLRIRGAQVADPHERDVQVWTPPARLPADVS